MRSKSIDAIINCAAYTNVDEAENDHLKANLVNNISVKNMVKLCAKIKIKLIHISTDYVFDGNQNRPYVESDNVNPIGVYGKTKRDGEIQILNSKIESVIIRTSWLYSQFGNNFVKKNFSKFKV